jgi:hypothetical protein
MIIFEMIRFVFFFYFIINLKVCTVIIELLYKKRFFDNENDIRMIRTNYLSIIIK